MSEEIEKTARDKISSAVDAIREFARHRCYSLWYNGNIQQNCADVLCPFRILCKAKTELNSILSSPPRNCDVGTPREQEDRFEKFCVKQKDCWECEISMFKGDQTDCHFRWMNLKYENADKGE